MQIRFYYILLYIIGEQFACKNTHFLRVIREKANKKCKYNDDSIVYFRFFLLLCLKI